MQKTYKSKSFLSISVAVGRMTCQDTQDSNKSVTKDVFKHITFEPDTTGYAYYSTADETEQKAIEAHPLFNKMFVLKDAPTSTVAKKAAEVLRRLIGHGVMKFLSLFKGSRSRSEIVATFLSVLELCRLHSVRIENEAGEQEIAFVQKPDEKDLNWEE